MFYFLNVLLFSLLTAVCSDATGHLYFFFFILCSGMCIFVGSERSVQVVFDMIAFLFSYIEHLCILFHLFIILFKNYVVNIKLSFFDNATKMFSVLATRAESSCMLRCHGTFIFLFCGEKGRVPDFKATTPPHPGKS